MSDNMKLIVEKCQEINKYANDFLSGKKSVTKNVSRGRGMQKTRQDDLYSPLRSGTVDAV